MKLWRSLGRRMLAAAVLSGLAWTLGALLFALHVGISSSVTITSRTAFAVLREAPVLCSASAGSASAGGASHHLANGTLVEAFDAADLRTPAGFGGRGPLPSLAARVLAGEDAPVEFHFPLFEKDARWGGALLVKTAEAGPCSLIQTRWPVAPDRRRLFLLSLLLAAGAAAATGLLGSVLAIRPVLRRVRRLHGAAAFIGDAQRYRGAGDQELDELGELGGALDGAHARVRADASRIEDQKHALERHLADVAHDLKTPIASLQLSLELCAGAGDERDRAALLTRGLEDTVYLAELTGNLRLGYQLGDGLDPLAGDPRVDLGLVVERVARRLRLLARRRGVAIEVARPDEEVWIRCDPTMAQQVVSNLVYNAMTHGGAGGHAAVVLQRAPGGRFRLEVLDDGPGIPEQEIARLGERRFRSAEARRRDPAGSGFGVSIAREVCRRCGFAIAFAANRPRGLAITIEGETASAPALPRESPPGHAVSGDRLRLNIPSTSPIHPFSG